MTLQEFHEIIIAISFSRPVIAWAIRDGDKKENWVRRVTPRGVWEFGIGELDSTIKQENFSESSSLPINIESITLQFKDEKKTYKDVAEIKRIFKL